MSPFRVAVMFTVVVSFLCPHASRSAEDSAVLFRNVRIFNGVDAELTVGDVLIEGDPFEDISILERPEESLAVIMKHGEFHKR